MGTSSTDLCWRCVDSAARMRHHDGHDWVINVGVWAPSPWAVFHALPGVVLARLPRISLTPRL